MMHHESVMVIESPPTRIRPRVSNVSLEEPHVELVYHDITWIR